MSAYVVEPKTINRILTSLSYGLKANQSVANEAKRRLNKIEWDIDSTEHLRDLGQAMYNLNVNAVSQRYPEDTEATLPGTHNTKTQELTRFKFKEEHCSTLQTYQSLRCWLYQCAEGNVTETALYKTFEKIKDGLARHIIEELPEYDQTEWA